MSDTHAGIRRIRHGASFTYADAAGKPISDEATLARIRKLAIPPAYESVWICADPQGHLQATGRDARGRKQYRYHIVWQQERGDSKFDSLRSFGDVLPRIRARVRRDLAPAKKERPTRTRVLATVVRLLDTTFIRIGNEEYARGNGSYGLTTLRCRHVDVKATELRLSFKGKSGVRHEVQLDDARVAAVVRQCRQLPGQELFQYVDEAGDVHRITSADVNEYLAEAAGADATDGLHVTAKDFRTWHGTVLALDFIRLACRGPLVRGAVKEVIANVAKRLGNTVAVCRKSYVHPRVLDLGATLDNEQARAAVIEGLLPAPSRAGRGLSAAERRLMALLVHTPPGLEELLARSLVATGPRDLRAARPPKAGGRLPSPLARNGGPPASAPRAAVA